MNIVDIRSKLDEKKGQRNLVEQNIKRYKKEARQYKQELEDLEQALIILQEVAKLTQEEIKFHITEIVNLALETIFPDPYEFCLDFEMKRNQTEAAFSLERDGNKIDPMTAAGGGIIDVIAFALRVSLWALSNPRTRNVLILDEPFRFVSQDLKDNVSIMLHDVSSRLNLQMIIVTHEQSLIEHADKVFHVEIKKGNSKVQEA